MKNTFLIIYFILISFSSIGSDVYTKFEEDSDGNDYYFKNIKSKNKYIFFEQIEDYPLPDKDGILCRWNYKQVNCKNYSQKIHNFQVYFKPLCKGEGKYDQLLISIFLKQNRSSWFTPMTKSKLFKMNKKLCSIYNIQ